MVNHANARGSFNLKHTFHIETPRNPESRLTVDVPAVRFSLLGLLLGSGGVPRGIVSESSCAGDDPGPTREAHRHSPPLVNRGIIAISVCENQLRALLPILLPRCKRGAKHDRASHSRAKPFPPLLHACMLTRFRYENCYKPHIRWVDKTAICMNREARRLLSNR